MVPTLTCGLSRSNFSFATLNSLLYRLVCPPLWRRTSEIYLTALLRDCSVLVPRCSRSIRPRPRRLGRNRFAGPRFYDLLGDIRRDLFVVLELHRVVGAPLGVGAKVGRVAEHLAQRDLCGHGQRVATALLTFDASTAPAEVADHVAEEVVGGDDLDSEDRLEQNRLGPFGGLFEGQRAGDFEGYFRRVYVVVLAVH